MWERTRDCMMTPSKLRPIIGWATIFFIFNVPVFTALCFVLNTEQLQLLSLIYISEISILAMVAGLGSWWQSLRVEDPVVVLGGQITP